ncbi:hypothetical protein [Streptomyces thermoalcalitolerans]|uniref:HEAT repeat domain-containing protein n=1 Tax=Streptomyces thermoalcalitolerans TaxID=65605 RepID=A0ABP3Z9T6_9ACTN
MTETQMSPVPGPAEEMPGTEPGSLDHADDGTEPEERTQEARAAQRELFAHTPGFILESAASFGGSLIGGAQYGVSGGQVRGDVYLGGRTEIHHHGPAAASYVSGEIPRERLDALAAAFVEGPVFATALRRLREERVLVLSGAHACGRYTAAQMLLHRLKTPAVYALPSETTPATLPGQLTRSGGYVLRDLPLTRNRPLRDTHLYAAADQVRKTGGYLVVTVDKSPFLHGVVPVVWEPPDTEAVVRAHLAVKRGGDDLERLLALAPVRDFLSRDGHGPAQAAEFAEMLAGYDGTADAMARLEDFGQAAVEKQCRDRLSDTQAGLRDKAFLIALAVFDRAPYVLAAEFADRLFVHLQRLQRPEEPPEIPVFGEAADIRLERAGAEGEMRSEDTEWGPVPQFTAFFPREDIPRVLLSEVWTGHPSARPALVTWLKELARDRRPVVRTRAAAAAALLAQADLSSAVALLIDGWAVSSAFGARVTAANTLVLAQLLDAPAVLQLLTQWCTDRHWARRWTAIRAFGLLAPLRPDLAGHALGALAARARAESSNPAERNNLVESTALLLSVGARRGEMLSELVRLLQHDTPAVRSLALQAFTRACDNAEEGALVEWYADTGMYEADSARDVAVLWRTALGDRAHTRQALDALHTWVYVAQHRPDAAQALELLLPALVVTAADRDRLDHELRTLRAEDGSPHRPPVADRLLAVLHSAAASPENRHYARS